MDTTETNRDMLYRAFALMTPEDAKLIASALRHESGERGVFASRLADFNGPKNPDVVRNRAESQRLKDLYEIANEAATL